MALFIREPNKAVISNMSNGKPLIMRFDCRLEIVRLLNLHCRLTITLTGSQGSRYFKLSKVCSEITIYRHEFLQYRRQKLRLSLRKVHDVYFINWLIGMYICMKMNDNDNTDLFGTCWGEYRILEKDFRDTER